MHTAIKIRRMKLGDAVTVTRLHRNTIRLVNRKDYPNRIIKVWSGRIKANWLRKNFHTEKRYVAVSNKKIVGFCNLSPNGKALQALYVRQNYIGRGVGSALIRKAEQVIRQAGGTKIVITSTLTARKFYERHGFKAVRLINTPLDSIKIRVWKMEKGLR